MRFLRGVPAALGLLTGCAIASEPSFRLEGFVLRPLAVAAIAAREAAAAQAVRQAPGGQIRCLLVKPVPAGFEAREPGAERAQGYGLPATSRTAPGRPPERTSRMPVAMA